MSRTVSPTTTRYKIGLSLTSTDTTAWSSPVSTTESPNPSVRVHLYVFAAVLFAHRVATMAGTEPTFSSPKILLFGSTPFDTAAGRSAVSRTVASLAPFQVAELLFAPRDFTFGYTPVPATKTSNTTSGVVLRRTASWKRANGISSMSTTYPSLPSALVRLFVGASFCSTVWHSSMCNANPPHSSAKALNCFASFFGANGSSSVSSAESSFPALLILLELLAAFLYALGMPISAPLCWTSWCFW
mmetsp:Transcript_20182/g.49492  ORF Transcript_20182/g.49492 Transcript_20182/m.49492 type:complete len:244 (+) Transcript_20182:571-1302(+)